MNAPSAQNMQSQGPLLVSLPYPTALLSAVQFAKPSPGYSARRERPIMVLMLAQRKRRVENCSH